jgi:hypothetical protein
MPFPGVSSLFGAFVGARRPVQCQEGACRRFLQVGFDTVRLRSFCWLITKLTPSSDLSHCQEVVAHTQNHESLIFARRCTFEHSASTHTLMYEE